MMALKILIIKESGEKGESGRYTIKRVKHKRREYRRANEKLGLWSYIQIDNIQNQVRFQNQTMQPNFEQFKSSLLNDSGFISEIKNRLNQSSSISLNAQTLNQMIESISQLLDQLIKKKMEQQMWAIVEDNNRILQQIKENLYKSNGKILQPNIEIENQKMDQDGSLFDLHNYLNDEKKKAFDNLSDQEMERSLSMLEKCEDVIDKVNSIQKKVKAMEDRYETNFKSLWNVLSMTQAAVFDHIKQNKIQRKSKESLKQTQKQSTSVFKFWK